MIRFSRCLAVPFFLAFAVVLSPFAVAVEREPLSLLAKAPAPTSSSNSRIRSENSVGRVYKCNPGPWGDLQYFTTYLEVPIPLIRIADAPLKGPNWNFVGYTDAQVEAAFLVSKVPEPFLSRLKDRSKWIHNFRITTVIPDAETILGLPEACRTELYTILGKWPENDTCLEPYVIWEDSVDKWLGRDNMRAELVDVIRKTVYRRGSRIVFSDLPLLYSMAQSDRERLEITKALSRTPTLIVTIGITKDSNVEALADYWTAGFKRKDIKPFLEAMAEVEGGQRLDVIHLLPPTPRKLLNSFPNFSQGFTGQFPDCHWTSLNFFNYDSIPRLVDTPLASSYAVENFAPVTGPHKFGDVLFFSDANGANAFHSCVFVADDIVFTKNGRSIFKPWVLMKLQDILDLYRLHYKLEVKAYRRKSGSIDE